MKWNFLGALMMSIALASPSFATCCLLDKMLGGGCGCCEEASCSCCEKSCCCEEASCGCEDSCCSSCGCGGGGCCVLDRLSGLLGGHHGCGCCEASCCCEPSCGCASSSCGCEGGSDDAAAPAEEAAPEENASARMIPPLPMADPNASISRERDVVRTSFTR